MVGHTRIVLVNIEVISISIKQMKDEPKGIAEVLVDGPGWNSLDDGNRRHVGAEAS